MAKYAVLFQWTDQGVKTVKESVNRVDQAQSAFTQLGVKIEDIYWTIGEYDLVGIVDAPDDSSLATALLKLAEAGNVRTTTLRAFDRAEFGQILSKLG
jgi:uncharacterized protein with GYD domain